MTATPRRAVVVGAGAFGSAAAVELARRGWDVTLVDSAPGANTAASSMDVSKVVRMDYGADVFYHELAEEALYGWDRWNAEWPRQLYHEDGFLLLSRGPMRPGGFEYESWRTLRERGYEPERLDRAAIERRFPEWRARAHPDGYVSSRAGWAEGEAVVGQLRHLAASEGVRLRTGAFSALVEEGSHLGGVALADGDRIRADVVVVSAGAWTPSLLPWLGDRMWSVAQPVLYLQPARADGFRGPGFPPWAVDIANTGWYGFPALPDGRVKIGHHGRGMRAHPDRRGDVSEAHVARLRAFLAETIPALADAPLAGRRVCMYADTFDGDFLIDRDPDREGLVIAAGGSGHGFKFVPLIGGLVADAVEGHTNRWAHRFRWRAPGPARTEEARFTGA